MLRATSQLLSIAVQAVDRTLLPQLACLQSKRYFNYMPYVIETSSRGERAYDIYSRLLKERIVCVNGPIDDSTSSVVVAQLLYLESQHPEQPVGIHQIAILPFILNSNTLTNNGWHAPCRSQCI